MVLKFVGGVCLLLSFVNIAATIHADCLLIFRGESLC